MATRSYTSNEAAKEDNERFPFPYQPTPPSSRKTYPPDAFDHKNPGKCTSACCVPYINPQFKDTIVLRGGFGNRREDQNLKLCSKALRGYPPPPNAMYEARYDKDDPRNIQNLRFRQDKITFGKQNTKKAMKDPAAKSKTDQKSGITLGSNLDGSGQIALPTPPDEDRTIKKEIRLEYLESSTSSSILKAKRADNIDIDHPPTTAPGASGLVHPANERPSDCIGRYVTRGTVFINPMTY
jgi:hypothetical protein